MRVDCFFLLFSCSVGCMRVLSVLPSPTRSHYLPGRRIILELVRRGHEVVSISPFEERVKNNFTWVEVEVKSIFDAVPHLRESDVEDYSLIAYQNYIWSTMNAYTRFITKQPKLAAFLLSDRSTFDLVFVHEFFMPLFYVLGYKYNAPIVAISTFGHASHIDSYTNNVQQSAIHEFSRLKYPLHVFDEMRNWFYKYYDIVGRIYRLHGFQNALVADVYGLESVPDLEILESNISAVFVNSHFSSGIVRANSPNVVEIGGVHIEDLRPLNPEFKQILDEALDGAILLSLGSFIQFGSQKEEFISIFLKVLSSLKQTVIIKWSPDRNISEYRNLYAFPWLPQSDILAHPNILLFVNHGGMLSNHEAVYHGVPLLCIPFQASQPLVCQTSAVLGYAIHLPKEELCVRSLNSSIHALMFDGSFKRNALDVSRRFKDRPSTALHTAVFWIEYCAKHGHIFKKNIDHSTLFPCVLFCATSFAFCVCVYGCRYKNVRVKEKRH